MTLGTAFIFFAALALVAFLAFLYASLRTMFAHQPESVAGPNIGSGERERLLEEKDALLRSIKDLEFDHEAGKVGDDDFQQVNARLRTRGREVLRLLDESVEAHREEARKMIAAHLETTAARLASNESASVGAESESDDRSEEFKRCSECDTDNDLDAGFCKRCGTRLEDDSPKDRGEAHDFVEEGET